MRRPDLPRYPWDFNYPGPMLTLCYYTGMAPCETAPGVFDHADPEYKDDSFDYGGPFGSETHQCGHWECANCGAGLDLGGRPSYDDDFTGIDWA